MSVRPTAHHSLATASRRLVAQYGFFEVGEQWDDEDGLETIFQVDANPSQ